MAEPLYTEINGYCFWADATQLSPGRCVGRVHFVKRVDGIAAYQPGVTYTLQESFPRLEDAHKKAMEHGADRAERGDVGL